MEDGYYLSAYLHIDEISHLYQFHIRHDQNVSLWRKKENCIELVHYWELERVTGIKMHRMSMFNHKQAIDFLNTLLSRYQLCLDDMQAIIGTPLISTVTDYHSLKEYRGQSYHSIAHLFSSLMLDTDIFYQNDILGFAVDGGPDAVVDTKVNEKNYYTGCFSSHGKVEVFDVLSPGFIWTYARKKFKLREGTLMALATASKSELICKTIEPMIEIRGLKDLQKANQYIIDLWERIEGLSESDQGILFNEFDDRFSEYDNKVSMAAKEIQKMSLRIMDYNIVQSIKAYGIDPKQCYIALSGGYILNCPTNSYIMEKYKFKGFLAPPCVNDAGISMGMALYYFYKNMDRVDFKLKHAYYGNSFMDSVFPPEGFCDFIESSSELDSNEFVKDIENGPVIWFYGSAEIGPRALGHRSIIADPRSKEAKDRLNEVKQRQWWRPVAPIVLTESMNKWFEKTYMSPFMLHTMKVKEERTNEVIGICHLDHTARLQTLERVQSPVLYDLIHCFYEKTGIPIICNTSLNDVGEPIIDTIEECLNFALRKGFNVIYINGKRIVLKNHKSFSDQGPLPRPMDIDTLSQDQKTRLKKKYNPFDLPEDVLIYRQLRPEIVQKFDITTEKGSEELKKYAVLSKQTMGNIPIPRL